MAMHLSPDFHSTFRLAAAAAIELTDADVPIAVDWLPRFALLLSGSSDLSSLSNSFVKLIISYI
jgi:hypothetical protein